jgi:hypothetical protein
MEGDAQAERRSFASDAAAEAGQGNPDEAAGRSEIDDQLAMGEDPTAQAMAEKLRREAQADRASPPGGRGL